MNYDKFLKPKIYVQMLNLILINIMSYMNDSPSKRKFNIRKCSFCVCV